MNNPTQPRFNPYTQGPAALGKPTNDKEHSDEEWDRFGPTENDNGNEEKPLPPLYAHKLLSQVKTPYTGYESTYNWYHTLRSSVQQYGILMHSIDQISLNKSICPKKYYGTRIDATRYKDMSNALYQLLLLPDTVPYEYTEVRNIIHRNATTSDGYVTVYEILEQIHPVLNQDAKLRQPTTLTCTDIHEYYRQYDSYLLHNRLMGVEFNTRRKVNLFIEGLDSTYDFAINRLQQHMMTWRRDDPNPPDALQIPALARTVEKIMQESGNQPTVRAMNKQTTPRPNYQKDHKPPTTPQRPYVDIQCKFCGRHSHKKSTCDKMAIWCLMQDAHKQIDEKFKA